ncbi:Pro-kumamolisin, activation domain-containing protein [Mycena capillaripes]|nr:Pro-kumamolisin, activation domain-containing protein [Mycena capillaripes]
MLKYHLSILLALLVGVRSEFIVLGKRDTVPPDFSLIGSPPADEILTLRLALAQSNMESLHDEISTPGSPRYGQYLTQAEVDQFVALSAETISQVNSWLPTSNVTASPLTSAGDWISVNMTATNLSVGRTLSYSIPITFKPSIDWVHPTISFPDPQALRAILCQPNQRSPALVQNRGAFSFRRPVARSYLALPMNVPTHLSYILQTSLLSDAKENGMPMEYAHFDMKASRAGGSAGPLNQLSLATG